MSFVDLSVSVPPLQSKLAESGTLSLPGLQWISGAQAVPAGSETSLDVFDLSCSAQQVISAHHPNLSAADFARKEGSGEMPVRMLAHLLSESECLWKLSAHGHQK